MKKESFLQGVAHNIAHHAGSGLSYISPHLSNTLSGSGINTTEINLLSDSPYPENVLQNKPLRMALMSLREKAENILIKHGLSFDQVTEMKLLATPAPWDKGDHSLHTRVVITSINNKRYDSGWLNEAGCTL